MAQRPAFDMAKLSNADKIIGAGAGIFFVWSILPIWYEGSFTAWFSVTTISGVASLLAILALLADMSGATGLRRTGTVHLALAGLALLFVLIGVGDKPSGLSVKWGLWVSLLWAIVWGYGAYMKQAEGGAMPPAEGGFTA
jgi:hypothetical protein